MRARTFFNTAATIFLIVGILHLVRAILSWSLVVEGLEIHLGFSYILGMIMIFLGYTGLRLSNQKRIK